MVNGLCWLLGEEALNETALLTVRLKALRMKVRDLAEFASNSDPANNDLKRRYAFSISGVASVQGFSGQAQLKRNTHVYSRLKLLERITF